MDEHGMENEHLEQKNSSNTEYLPTKCRVTKPSPPKPATNPLQFIKVAPPPLFQKAKEQVSKVEKIKRERKEIQDEAEDWQANLDNWKSSRRKLQEHIIERVVEVKKFEHEDNGRTRRKIKTFSEILEERGKSKYSIPVYIDETNTWDDYGISDSKSDHSQTSGQNNLDASDQYSSDEFSPKKNDVATSAAEYSSNFPRTDDKLSWNDYKSSHMQLDSKDSQDNISKNGQYTYESAIEGYRSRIKSKIDNSILVKISDMPKRSSEVEALVPRGEIVKRKELFDKPQSDNSSVPNSAARVLQDFESSISIKQRLKSLEKCGDQTMKYVDNINIIPKVKQISQLFDKTCTDIVTNNHNNEITQNNNTDYTHRREKININIVPWTERETASDTSEIDIYMDKNYLKEVESQSDDKSSDTFYSGLEDTNYPPSISSTDYMALSSDRDSGIHTADVSCSVSQADDTAEELESNTNSHEIVNDDYQLRSKYFKETEDNNNVFGSHILKLTKENVTNQTNIESQEDDSLPHYSSSTVSSFSKENIFDSTARFLERLKEDASRDMQDSISIANTIGDYSNLKIHNIGETSQKNVHLPEIKDEILKLVETKNTSTEPVDNFGLLNISEPYTPEFNNQVYLFDSDFPLLPTKMVEPPKVKPPPPPVFDDVEPMDASVQRMNSTKRIKKEITLKRSNFLGLNEPNDVETDPLDGISIAAPEEEQSKVEEILAKQLYESKICDYGSEIKDDKFGAEDSDTPQRTPETMPKNSRPSEEDEITKREREIIEMVEKAEKFRDADVIAEKEAPILVQKPPLPLVRTVAQTTFIQKPADASYYDKQPDYLDDQDSEVLKVEQELQQLEQEELKRKRDNLLFRQACSRVFAKNKRYSLENIFDAPKTALECRKSMPELQCLKMEKEASVKTPNIFRSIRDIDLKYRKSVPNIPGYVYPGYNHSVRNDFQTIDKYERKSVPEFQHDMQRSAFQVPARKPMLPYESISGTSKPLMNNKFVQHGEPLVHNKQSNFFPTEEPPLIKPRSRNALNCTWLKTRPNIETKSYDQHWLYQEAELRRLQDQKNHSSWQQSKHLSEPPAPNLIQRGPITPSHGSSKSSIRKLGSMNNDVQPYLEHHPPVGPSLPVTQPRSFAVEENQNRILSVSGKKKCSFCGNELGRGAAMIIETLCLFYHMECFKCCVCHVQLGNGLNGTDVRVRNQKLHCHNCYSSDDGVKFSRV